MKNEKSDPQTSWDKVLEDINSWGILTLMMRMKDQFLYDLEKERSVIARYQLQPYEDSPLQFLDLYREAFERKFSEEFGKIYKQKEDEKQNNPQ